MIQAKILFIEQEIVKSSKIDMEKLAAVKKIKILLKEIDFKAEVIPLENAKTVRKLLESLKNEPLNNHEFLIVKELIKY